MNVFKFKPILKETIWGGSKITEFKQTQQQAECIGESWEISAVPGSESIVAEGPYEGVSLPELIDRLRNKLVGRENYLRFGNRFPLLIKFIDAHRDLSIQVHPSDEIAHQHGLPCGKTEMWYVMESEPHASLYSGLSRQLTPESYEQIVAENRICDALAKYQVKENDVFFLPAGRIHAIGAGTFLAEIQQTSDVTYRIYDYNRRDKNGNLRELHTKQAAECIDYTVHSNYRTEYQQRLNEGVNLVQCPYFTTSVYNLTEPMTIDYSDLDSFVVLIALKGAATFTSHDGSTFTLRAGESVLVPATTRQLQVQGTIKFLETFV